MQLTVRGNELICNGNRYRCAIGKGGFSADKREGDGRTPLGTFSLRECWYRPDRMDAPVTGLPVHKIHEYDGWCDDPESPDYNSRIRHPYSYSHERLWRDDHVYDLIIPIGYNDDPIVTGRGSAIFMHLARPAYEPTEGCVALSLPDFHALLPHLNPRSCIEITAG